jgi:hypothetical protein
VGVNAFTIIRYEKRLHAGSRAFVMADLHNSYLSRPILLLNVGETLNNYALRYTFGALGKSLLLFVLRFRKFRRKFRADAHEVLGDNVNQNLYAVSP